MKQMTVATSLLGHNMTTRSKPMKKISGSFTLMRLGVLLALLIAATSAKAAETVLSFSGNGYYVNLGTPAALQIPANHALTVEGWMYFRGTPTTAMLYSKNNGRAKPYDYMLGFNSSMITAYDGGAWRYPTPAGSAVQIDRWYHTAFSYDGTNMAFYLNGERVGQYANWTFANHTTYSVKLGGYSDSSGDINGYESDVRVWNHARSDEQISTLMQRRLTGTEPGLVGYWPLNEGRGSSVFDQSGNGSTGTIVKAEWVTVPSLDLLSPEGFLNAMPLTVANIETGSEHFTNSNGVNLVECPIPQGYDLFQFTLTGSPNDLVPAAWASTNSLPAQLDFPRPASDTNQAFYVWFTNSEAQVTLRRAAGEILFTTNPPLPTVQASLTRPLLDSSFVRVYPNEVDAGSLGGNALGETMGLHHLSLSVESGPDADTTPDQPYITVAQMGTYSLRLTAVNEAGNVATSTVCTLVVTPSDGNFVWKGHTDSDWHNPANWQPVGLPSTGDSVQIDSGASVQLTNSTPILHAITITNATLTQANWNTALRADSVTVDNGGVLTLPGPFSDSEMSNRVWIVCNDFTLAAGGVIDADGQGYAGGYGPSSAGTAMRTSGGGYGGRGGCNPQWGDSRYGLAYGTPAGPLQPGSGGCGIGSGGAGGGLVQIEAADTITIHGAIRADGLTGLATRYQGPGGGSGGGVYLTCQTFAGSSSGSISVCGGIGVKEKATPAAPRGGGGRIAIHYEQASPWPRVVINADVGASGSETESYGESMTAQWGSLYVSDDSLLQDLEVLNAATFPTRHVALLIPGFSMWQVASLTVTNAAFRFGDTNVTLRVNGKLTIGSGGRLGAARIEAGSVLLTNGGSLDIRSGSTASPFDWGGHLVVAGDLDIADNSILSLYTDYESGGVPMVRARNLHVAVGGQINAAAKGFRNSRGEGAGSINTKRSGGGYGGQGGSGTTADPTGGLTYGSAVGPLQAGSGGCYDGHGGDGGGLAHIEVADTITLHGTITARGGDALDGQYGSAGGGSGGGLFLACRKLAGDGMLSAGGGNGREYTGGGGGGRIALWTGVSRDNFPHLWQSLLATGEAPGAMTSTNTLPPTFDGTFATSVDLTGGTGYQTGAPGTYRWVAIKSGTLLLIR